jgi:integrase
VDPKVMQQRLGHSRPDIVMRHYAHVLDENADRAADLISGKLGYMIPAEFAVNPVEV